MKKNEYLEKNNFGKKMLNLIKRLYPICRSITGKGVRDTLKIINEHIPIKIYEIPTGTKVFDWEVPKEWNIKDAYIKDSKGKKIVDFKKSNLHLLNYSIPVHKKMTLNEIKQAYGKHFFTLPKNPDWIPYVTSYYKENWGFCMTQNQYENLSEDTYEVFIDSELKNGHLTYGELIIEGNLKEEILVSTYICHPSLCNDNLSGIVLSTFLAKYLINKNLKYTYRFLFIPETIGSITWLSLNEKNIPNIKFGFVITCVGDSGNITFKKTKNGDTNLDRATIKVLYDLFNEKNYQIINFVPMGSDERQYSSPGINIPIVSIMRTQYTKYPQYHTSADAINIMNEKCLDEIFNIYIKVIDIIENDKIYMNKYSKCEPQLGKRGVYSSSSEENLVFKWILNMSDGKHSLLDIAIRSSISFEKIKNASDILYSKGLISI